MLYITFDKFNKHKNIFCLEIQETLFNVGIHVNCIIVAHLSYFLIILLYHDFII